MTTYRVEIGVDLSVKDDAPFFRLDDPVRGRLDNVNYPLAGFQFVDVTEHVSAVNVTRGKEPIETNYPAGECEVQFNNHNRWFDPLYEGSPFFGNIVPRREVKIFTNDIEIYRGWIDDWDLNYQKDGDSITIAKAFDALSLFNNQTLNPFTPVEQLTGARINAVLDKPEIDWPSEFRAIDPGWATLAANPLEDSVPVLDYLQSMAGSDPGSIYVSREGKFTFIDRSKIASSANIVEFGGTAISFDNVTVTYGAELLFNEVTMTREGGGTVTVSDPDSIFNYGVRSLEITDSQVSTDAQLADIALSLAAEYSTPRYRFSAMDVYVHKFDTATQNKVLGLDFGSICKITFTPNNIGDPIERYLEVISIEHRIDVETHTVTLGFNEIAYAPLILDDVIFGRLDVGTLSW